MAQSILNEPHFQDADKAREYLEGIVWPDGPVCPHCGGFERIYPLNGNTTRDGLYKCGDCRKQFTVTVGTLFERSKVPLHIWLQAVYFMCSSKKGMSSHQLHRTLGVTYKTAWFMTHRIREAMKDPVFKTSYKERLGGKNKVVEADETYWGNIGKQRWGARGAGHKEKIFSLVERSGDVRSFHMEVISSQSVAAVMRKQIDEETDLMTDDFVVYQRVGREFKTHRTVRHTRGEYVRGPIHTNTVENYFSLLKRGLVGTFHHVGANHLKRYIGEFDFRYCNRHIDDVERTNRALAGIQGKRLFYRVTRSNGNGKREGEEGI